MYGATVPVGATPKHLVPARALLVGDLVVERKYAMPKEVALLRKGSAAVWVEYADGSQGVFLRHDRVALAN